MKPIRHLLLLLLVVGCITTLTSCVYDDDDITPITADDAITDGTHTSTFRITISAKESDTTRGTTDYETMKDGDTDASYYDDVAEEYEFMNSLAVFIVDSSEDGGDRIVYKFCTDSSATTGSDDATFGGNVVAWTSEAIKLPDGKYSIYAFSNWETVTDSSLDEDEQCTEWAKIIEKVVYEEDATSGTDNTLSSTDLSFYVSDPASKIKLSGSDPSTMKFIPMSGSGTFTLGTSTSDPSADPSAGSDVVINGAVSVALYRLVSKVTIGFMDILNEASSDIQTDAAGDDGVVFSISNLSISGFADKVALYSDSTPTGSDVVDPKYEMSYSTPSTAEPFTVKYASTEPTTPSDSFTFYVNAVETEQTNGFAISFDAVSYEDGQTDGITDNIKDVYTTTKKLDRNSILPIYLTPTEYYATTSVKAYTAAIDGEEKEYNYPADEVTSTFSISLYDVTTKVDITPAIMKATYDSTSGTAVTNVKYTWDAKNATGGVKISEGDVNSSDGTLTLNMPTAWDGWECTGLSFTASWTSSSNISHERTYQVSIKMTDGMPTFPSNLPRWIGPWQLATPTVTTTAAKTSNSGTNAKTSPTVSPAVMTYGEKITIPLR